MTDTDKELAELEKQINEKKEEEAKAPEPVKEEKEPEPQPEPKSEEPQDQEPSGETGFNATEWVKKKGWKSPEDAAKSLRELEKAMHEKNQELKRLKDQGYQPPQNGYNPPPNPYSGYQAPAYQPYQPPMYPPQGSYVPPANPYASRPNEETIAASYGLSVEDFRKVLAVSRDISEVQTRQIAQDYQRWKEEQENKNEKNTDMTSVLSDPAFHHPDVQYEMHEILSKNPSVWNERRPYTTALKEALVSIGRKNMTRGNSQSDVSFPNTPPQMAGSGSRGSQVSRRLGAMPTQQELEKKSPEELEKMLKGMNAVRTYADM